RTTAPAREKAGAGRAGRGLGRRIVIAIPFAWLLAFFLAPFLIVLKISLSQTAIAMPPYVPTFDLSAGLDALWQGMRQFSFDNYVFLTEDALYWKSYLTSLWIAATATVITLLVGYPIAYGMACAPRAWRPMLVMLVILPFWT